MDRALAEIIERCLAVNPNKRFPNVQAVLDALAAREESRLRRPLLLLGFVGPVLLLFIMGLFACAAMTMPCGIRRTSSRCGHTRPTILPPSLPRARSKENWSAYFLLIENEARDAEFCGKFAAVAGSGVVQRLNAQLKIPDGTLPGLQELRATFLEDPQRVELNVFLERRLAHHLGQLKDDPLAPKFASIFTLDAQGRMLASAYDDEVKERGSVGWNFAFRTYFHGRTSDIAGYTQQRPPSGIPPLRHTHLSAAFLSTATGKWKVAISTPVIRPGTTPSEIAGVLAFTVNLGDFAYFRSNGDTERFAVLIDGREGTNKGVILQHPHFDDLRRRGTPLKEPQLSHEVPPECGTTAGDSGNKRYRYQDPLAETSGGEAYAGDWIAAVERVRLPDADGAPQEMIVLIQQQFAEAVSPVKHLAQRLKREGLWALLGILGVVLVLWYIVMRMLQEPRARLRSTPSDPTAMTPRSSNTVAAK